MLQQTPPRYRYLRLMFGCTIDPAEFQQRFMALSGQARERLLNVGQRAWEANVIRYHVLSKVEFEYGVDQFSFDRRALPSLLVNHLFGCLDTVAKVTDEPDREHISFPMWLKENQEAIDNSFERKRSVRVRDVRELYFQYSRDYGVGITLRTLFAELSKDAAPLVSWLMEQLPITLVKGSDTAHEEVTEIREPSLYMTHLLDHYYERRRNPYTHESDTEVLRLADDVTLDLEPHQFWTAIRGSMTKPVHDKQSGDSYLRVMSMRTAMDEAIILQTIVFGAVLTRMHIVVTPGLIHEYVTSCSRQVAAYGLLTDIEQNSLMLSWWPDYSPGGGVSPFDPIDRSIYQDVDVFGIPLLRTKWSEALQARLQGSIEDQLGRWLATYRDALASLNTAISEFNSTHPRVEGDEQLLRRTAIAAFLSHWITTPEYGAVRQMPHDRMVMRHIRNISENPAYTY